ncbi:unnamed protein product, partial [Cyprideis torosa]
SGASSAPPPPSSDRPAPSAPSAPSTSAATSDGATSSPMQFDVEEEPVAPQPSTNQGTPLPSAEPMEAEDQGPSLDSVGPSVQSSPLFLRRSGPAGPSGRRQASMTLFDSNLPCSSHHAFVWVRRQPSQAEAVSQEEPPSEAPSTASATPTNIPGNRPPSSIRPPSAPHSFPAPPGTSFPVPPGTTFYAHPGSTFVAPAGAAFTPPPGTVFQGPRDTVFTAPPGAHFLAPP